jgi:hypothetical protein
MRFRRHLAHLIQTHKVSINLDALVVDLATVRLVEPEEGVDRVAITGKKMPAGLKRTNEYAMQENSLLHALASMILPEEFRVDEAINAITTTAVEWLQAHPDVLADYTGTRAESDNYEQLNRLWTPAQGEHSDNMLLLQGVAAAYRVCIAHVVHHQHTQNCQIIPVKSTGPFIGMVLLRNRGYEVLSWSN